MVFSARPPSPDLLTRRDALRFFGLAGATAVLAPSLGWAADPVPAKTPAAGGGAQTGFYRFNIGDFEAIALSDGGMAMPPQKSLWIGKSSDEIAAQLKSAYLPVDQFRVPFSVLLVRIGAELVLIDAGCGPLFGPIGGRLAANLASAGIRPEQITAVVLTHAHGDHMGGLLDATTKSPVFKNARHFINRREFEFWTAASPDLSKLGMPEADKKGWISGAQTFLGALKWEKIQPGEKLLGGLEIIDSPGHTPGHIAVQISSGNDQLLHLVDAVHHHAISFAHPDWDFAFDADPATANATRKRLLDRAAADRLRIFGAHLPFPALGHVRAAGDHFEYMLEPWVS